MLVLLHDVQRLADPAVQVVRRRPACGRRRGLAACSRRASWRGGLAALAFGGGLRPRRRPSSRRRQRPCVRVGLLGLRRRPCLGGGDGVCSAMLACSAGGLRGVLRLTTRRGRRRQWPAVSACRRRRRPERARTRRRRRRAAATPATADLVGLGQTTGAGGAGRGHGRRTSSNSGRSLRPVRLLAHASAASDGSNS